MLDFRCFLLDFRSFLLDFSVFFARFSVFFARFSPFQGAKKSLILGCNRLSIYRFQRKNCLNWGTGFIQRKRKPIDFRLLVIVFWNRSKNWPLIYRSPDQFSCGARRHQLFSKMKIIDVIPLVIAKLKDTVAELPVHVFSDQPSPMISAIPSTAATMAEV